MKYFAHFKNTCIFEYTIKRAAQLGKLCKNKMKNFKNSILPKGTILPKGYEYSFLIDKNALERLHKDFWLIYEPSMKCIERNGRVECFFKTKTGMLEMKFRLANFYVAYLNNGSMIIY